VAALLVNRKDELASEGLMVLSHNWMSQAYAKHAFMEGIDMGIARLLAL
jgi:hypothetical protein